MSELNIFEVDRKSESNEITKCVHEMLNNPFAPRVLLLFGNPRIGKTICINKAIYNLQNEFNYILKIDNDFLNNEINFYEKLFYLINKNRFKSFILKTKIKLGINFGLTLEGEIPNLYNYKTVVEKSFINKKTLFHIQIDKLSFNKAEFNNFFKYIEKNNFIIFEISSIETYNKIKKILKSKQLSYKTLEVQPIDIVHLKKILSCSEVNIPNDTDLEIKFKKCHYSITSLINELYDETPKNENNFPISNLSKETQIIVLIIFMFFREEFKIRQLHKIISTRNNKKLMTRELYCYLNTQKNIKKILNYLEDRNIIFFKKEVYIINKTHIEIIKNFIKNNNSNVNIILAYKILLNYSHLNSSSKFNEKFLTVYKNSLIVGDQETIFNNLDMLKKIETNKYKDILINIGEYIISSLKKGIYEQYSTKIDTIIFELIKINELDIAYKIFQQVLTENNSNHFILKISFKNANAKYFSNIPFEKLIIEGKDYGKKFEIYAEYVYVCYLYKNKNTNFGVKYAERLIDKYKTQDLTNDQKLILSFIYKNYSTYLDIESSIKYLNQSIDLLTEIKQYSIIPKIHISLSILYARMFKFKKAFKLTKQVYKKVKKNKIPFRYEYYYNNYSIIFLFQRKTTKKVEKFLYNALELSSSIFERAMILSNLLIHFVLFQNEQKCYEILKELEELDIYNFANERIKYAIFTNILFFYKKKNISEKIDYINSILRGLLNNANCSSEMNEVIKYQLGELSNVSPSFKHVVDLGYKPARIGYYTFDDSINLINN